MELENTLICRCAEKHSAFEGGDFKALLENNLQQRLPIAVESRCDAVV